MGKAIAGSGAVLAALVWAAVEGSVGGDLPSAGTVLAQEQTPPPGMVLIPAGKAIVGSDDPQADPDERPARYIFVDAFFIQKYEVTNAEYAEYDPAHTFPEGHENHPVTGLPKAKAEAYAAHYGMRLPAKAEWEKAARGADGRLFPWGNAFEPGRANMHDGDGLEPVGSYPEGVSPYGVHDMAGNAWEWIATNQRDRWAPGFTPREREIIKGGAFSYAPYQCRASYNGLEAIGSTCNDIGFRCVKDVR